MTLKDEVASLQGRINALEAQVRTILAFQGGPTPDRPSSAYTDEDAKKAQEAADKYIERRKEEIWGDFLQEQSDL